MGSIALIPSLSSPLHPLLLALTLPGPPEKVCGLPAVRPQPGCVPQPVLPSPGLRRLELEARAGQEVKRLIGAGGSPLLLLERGRASH